MGVNEKEVSMSEIFEKSVFAFSYLRRKWLLILGFCIVGAVVGFIYALLKKPVFTARENFVLEESSGMGKLGQYAGLASMAGIDIGGGGGLFEGDNIVELYKSRKMIKKTLLSKNVANGKEELLINRFIAFNGLRDKWSKNIKLSNISYNGDETLTLLQDSVLSVIVRDINDHYLTVSKPDKKLSIILVEVKSKDEIFAKEFTDQIVNNVNKFYVETKTKKSIQNINILQHQTDSVRAVMNGAIFTSAATVDNTPNLNPSRQILRVPVQKSQFVAETNKAVLSELLKNLELSKITLRKEMPLIQIIDNPVYPLQKDKLSKMKSTAIGGIIMGIATIFFLLVIGNGRKFRY